MPIHYERYPSTKYITDRISCPQQILVVVYLVMCLQHGLKVRCQRLAGKKWTVIFGICMIFSHRSPILIILCKVFMKHAIIWTIAKNKFQEKPPDYVMNGWFSPV